MATLKVNGTSILVGIIVSVVAGKYLASRSVILEMCSVEPSEFRRRPPGFRQIHFLCNEIDKYNFDKFQLRVSFFSPSLFTTGFRFILSVHHQ